MAKRQREWAIKARLELIELLGGMCELCWSRDELEIDHPHGRKWHIRKVDQSMRIALYRKETQAGLLRVLCKSCNSSPENRPVRKKTTDANDPF